jgi:hypothetical protein
MALRNSAVLRINEELKTARSVQHLLLHTNE